MAVDSTASQVYRWGSASRTSTWLILLRQRLAIRLTLSVERYRSRLKEGGVDVLECIYAAGCIDVAGNRARDDRPRAAAREDMKPGRPGAERKA
jgi:hypothetical protein